jgi:hypothetical protein
LKKTRQIERIIAGHSFASTVDRVSLGFCQALEMFIWRIDA